MRTGTCAFAAAAIPFTLRNTFGDYGKEMAVFQQNFPYLDRIDARIARKANVFYLNANEMDDAFVHLGANFFTGCYNIGYWAWEPVSYTHLDVYKRQDCSNAGSAEALHRVRQCCRAG